MTPELRTTFRIVGRRFGWSHRFTARRCRVFTPPIPAPVPMRVPADAVVPVSPEPPRSTPITSVPVVPDTPRPIDSYEAASCSGKAVFTSWGMAHQRARRMSRREHERGTGVRFEPYRCRANHIHIGSRDLISNRNPWTRHGRPRVDDVEE